MHWKLGGVILLVSACLAAASSAGAATTAQVCKSYKQGGRSYALETLGSAWTCAAAKSWAIKLSADRVGTVTKNLPLKNGPRGYHCFATPGSHGGHATSGTCIKGTIAFPGTGFAWIG